MNREIDYSDIHNWDLYGWPGEYIIGEDICLDDDHMDERWLRVKGFSNYWVSNKGRLWSEFTDSFVYGTPNVRTGHVDVSLKLCRNGVRIHRYMHRLVAEAFIPNPKHYPIVRHLDDNPENNCVENLAWGTQLDNIRDCISNGHFKYLSEENRELAMSKRRTKIVAVDLLNGEKYNFISQQEASRRLGISQGSISDVILGKADSAMDYYFYIDDGNEHEIPCMTNRKRSRYRANVKAINIHTGEEFVFHTLTEAASELDMSISIISCILSGKYDSCKGYTFELIDGRSYND